MEGRREKCTVRWGWREIFHRNPAIAVTWIRWPLAVSISVHYSIWFAISKRRETLEVAEEAEEKNVYPLTESHNVRAGDGGRRKWRVSIWKSEGVQELGRNTMRCHFFHSVFVWWCIERICLPAMSGSDPCGFLLSGSHFIFYTLLKTLLISTPPKPGGSYLDLWDLRNQTEICVLVRHCCWIKQGHVTSPLFAWQACWLNCGKMLIIGM